MGSLSEFALCLVPYFSGEVSIKELDAIHKNSGLTFDEFQKGFKELQWKNIIILINDKIHFEKPYFVPTNNLTCELYSNSIKKFE